MFSHLTMSPGPHAIFCRFFVSYIKAFKRGFIQCRGGGGLTAVCGREMGKERGRACFLSQRPGRQDSAFSHWKPGVFRWEECEALGRGVKISAAEGRNLWLGLCELSLSEPLQRGRGFFRVQLFLLPPVSLSGSSCLFYLLLK